MMGPLCNVAAHTVNYHTKQYFEEQLQRIREIRLRLMNEFRFSGIYIPRPMHNARIVKHQITD
jgi:hypothetical protein